MRRALRGRLDPIPIYVIDRVGAAQLFGELDLAYPDGSLFRRRGNFDGPLNNAKTEAWSDGLPYFLQDMRPDGYLGARAAKSWALELGVSTESGEWSDDTTLIVLCAWGTALTGNLIVGDGAYKRWLDDKAQDVWGIKEADVEHQYPLLARRMMEGLPSDLLVGGRFPKFTALRDAARGLQHVIVKFSGTDSAPSAIRWSDLLVCEQLASTCIGEQLGISASRRASFCLVAARSWRSSGSTAMAYTDVRHWCRGRRSTWLGSDR